MIELLYSLAMTLQVGCFNLKTQKASIPPCCCGRVSNVQTCPELNKVLGSQSVSWVWWCVAVQVVCLYVLWSCNLFAVSKVCVCLSILSDQEQWRHSQTKPRQIDFKPNWVASQVISDKRILMLMLVKTFVIHDWTQQRKGDRPQTGAIYAKTVSSWPCISDCKHQIPSFWFKWTNMSD